MGAAPGPAIPAPSSSSTAAGVASLSLSAAGPSRRTSRPPRRVPPPRLYLAVDCGGTKAAAVVCDAAGRVRGRGFGGPANYTDVGLAAFLRSVDCAVRAALASVAEATPSASSGSRAASRSPHDQSPYFTPSPVRAPAAATEPLLEPTAARLSPPAGVAPRDGSPAPFEAAWFGIAGVDSAADVTALSPHLAALLGLPHPSPRLIVANDTSLLAAPVTDPAHAHIRSGVVVIAGTGSIVMSFGQSDTGLLKTLGRVGGFGWLLGDEGSGYAVGRDAVRLVLDQADRERLLAEPGAATGSPGRDEEHVETAEHRLRDRILKHWGLASTDDLLNAVYSNDTPPSFPAIGASAAPSVASSSPSPAGSVRSASSSDEEDEAEQDEEDDPSGGATMIAVERPAGAARPALHESHATVRGRRSPRDADAAGARDSTASCTEASAEPSASLLPPSAPLVDTHGATSPIPSLSTSPSAQVLELPPGAAEESSSAAQGGRRSSLALPVDVPSGTAAAAAAAVTPQAVATAAAARAVGERKHRLASLAPLVFHLAFAHTDATCLVILRRQARAIAQQVVEVLRPGPASPAHLRADRSVLCCGGSLVGVARYRAVLEEELARLGVVFARVEYVGDPAMRGAAALAGVWEAKQTAP